MKAEVSAILKENPEIIIDVLKKNSSSVYDIVIEGQEKKQKMAEIQRRVAQMKNPLKPEIETNRIIKGNASAPITIVEYSDFQCPYCAVGAKTMEQLFKKYDGRIRLIYKHNPLPFHKAALPAAVYFEAIARQDSKKALKFHDILFADQRRLEKGEQALREIAASLGIDMKILDKDLKSKEVIERIQKDMAEANKFGFSGTPAFIVNGISLPGAYPLQEFIEVIEMTEKK
jgi:protein-disulfide isomerase